MPRSLPEYLDSPSLSRLRGGFVTGRLGAAGGLGGRRSLFRSRLSDGGIPFLTLLFGKERFELLLGLLLYGRLFFEFLVESKVIIILHFSDALAFVLEKNLDLFLLIRVE